MKGDVFLRPDEAQRIPVLERLLKGEITVWEGAQALGLSERHVLRLKHAFAQHGAAILAHKNRGRRPSHAVPDAVRQTVLGLALDVYRDASCQHMAELLAEYHQVHLSAKTIARILKAAGIPLAHTHKAARRRRSRERMPQAGALVQVDASPFAWLEDRGPHLCLHGAIDDATSQILGLWFLLTEQLMGYLQVLRQILQHHGVPVRLYSDRHTLFFSPKQGRLSIDEELAGQTIPLTQFGQALQALGIVHIPARSPQAKGRIERLWQTLQSRLVTELRIARVRTLDDANHFLPGFIERFNRRFAVAPKDPQPAFRPAPNAHELLTILALRETRKASAGSTISFQGKTYQLLDAHRHVVPLTPRRTVTVLTGLDGVRRALYAGQVYTLQELDVVTPPPLPNPTPVTAPPPSPRPTSRPPATHPWRRPFKDMRVPRSSALYT
ncbi:ISNCY family transposase [Carboxydochorda subterranea]|uniref:ISNCY family transposase n=1 Tax=Carboxydichorda subterranea TaxID=3109565 RepID=A0ABZ1C162_9FIRM|nr:ISNCY family transposase [Limnochorda sp. L945t]WRP18767.1 ISNCY family transposase [Limnochorda sp. L945t]